MTGIDEASDTAGRARTQAMTKVAGMLAMYVAGRIGVSDYRAASIGRLVFDMVAFAALWLLASLALERWASRYNGRAAA